MNKKLIALAVAAGLVAPMTANAAPTVWGKAHVSIDLYDSGNPGNNQDFNYLASNSSRLGVKGSEDIGGGLKALYAYEMLFDITDGGGIVGNRNSYVGLGGAFGKFLMGRHDTPMKTIGRKIDLFGDRVGDLRNLTRPNSGGGTRWDERLGNVLVYATPKFGPGMQVVGAYTLEDGSPDSNALSIALTGKGGPVKYGVAYEKHDLGTNNGDETALRGTVSMKFGITKINLGYSTMSDQGNIAGRDSDIASVGLAFKVGGKNVIKAQYATRSNDQVVSGDADVLAVGFDHNFSKNVTGYVMYASTDNETNATYRVDSAGHQQEGVAPTAGNDPDAISAGLIVKF